MPEPHRLIAMGEQLHGRYTIEDAIGEGGQACVFKAHDSITCTTVIIKQLRADPASVDYAAQVARFQRAASIHVPHSLVVNPIDSFEERGRFIVYPWIDGRELGQLPLPMPREEVVAIGRSLCETLDAVHRAGVIHRDLKPQNIIVDAQGKPHLIDFGIAKISGVETLTPAGSAVGTPMHIAPEQLRGEPVDGRTDLCALGHVLYLLLTGHSARGGDEDSIKQQALRETPPPPSVLEPGIPPELDTIIVRLCAIRPEDRFPNARSVLDAFDRFIGSAGQITRCLACGARVGETDHKCRGCSRAFGSDRRLLVRQPSAGETGAFVIPQGRYVVGRDQIAPDDPRVSRVQCAIGHGSDLVIRDADAKNPTTLDGVVVTRTTLARDGQRLSCAGHTFVIRCSTPSPMHQGGH